MSRLVDLESLWCRSCAHVRWRHHGGSTECAGSCDVPGCGCTHYQLDPYEVGIELHVGTTVYQNVTVFVRRNVELSTELWVSGGGRYAWPTESRVGALLLALHNDRTRLYALEKSLPRDLQPRSEAP